MTDRRRHIPALDGLRALAIAVVIVHNSSINEAHGDLVAKLWTFVTDSGWVGVQLFFVLSGYLITGILLETKSLRTFYVRRSPRIFPLYYLFLIGRFVIAPEPATAQLGYWLYVSNWTDLCNGGIQGMTHFWSLAVEEQFYLVWPWLVRTLSRRAFTWTCVALAIAALAARLAMRAADLPHAWMYSSTIARMDGLAIGSLVALGIPPRVQRWATGISLVGLAGVAAYAHGLSRYNPVVQTFGYTLLAVVFAAIVADVARPLPRAAWRWLEHPALRLVGKYSYAMYLFHLPLKFLLQRCMADQLGDLSATRPIATDMAWVLAVGLGSFAIAAISWRVIERPFVALKDRLAPAT